MAYSWRFARLLVVSLVLLWVASCERRTVNSTVSTTIGLRTVKATVDGSASMSTEDDSALLRFGSHKVAVEDDRLLLDGEEQARFSARAEQVEIDVSNGQLTATVDGKQVLQKTLD